MSELMVALVSLAWLMTAGGQAPASKPNPGQQPAQVVAQQRGHAGDHTKGAAQAPKPKVTDTRKAGAADAATARAANDRQYPGMASGPKAAAKPQS